MMPQSTGGSSAVPAMMIPVNPAMIIPTPAIIIPPRSLESLLGWVQGVGAGVSLRPAIIIPAFAVIVEAIKIATKQVVVIQPFSVLISLRSTLSLS